MCQSSKFNINFSSKLANLMYKKMDKNGCRRDYPFLKVADYHSNWY